MTRDETESLSTADFDYELPSELIAQAPVEPRDSSASWSFPEQAVWSIGHFETFSNT